VCVCVLLQGFSPLSSFVLLLGLFYSFILPLFFFFFKIFSDFLCKKQNRWILKKFYLSFFVRKLFIFYSTQAKLIPMLNYHVHLYSLHHLLRFQMLEKLLGEPRVKRCGSYPRYRCSRPRHTSHSSRWNR